VTKVLFAQVKQGKLEFAKNPFLRYTWRKVVK
jgi:hypothetical protein